MVDIGKALMAIEEKEKWEEREKNILEELKELKKRTKELKYFLEKKGTSSIPA